MPSNDMTGPLPQSLNSLNPTAHVDLPSAQPERPAPAPAPAPAPGPERRAYLCNFCQRSFKRSDTRRLHFGRCPSRISTGKRIPPAAQKGRKPRACDACAHRKRACNEETPCSQCVTRKIACTRNRAISSKSADVINGLVANKQPSSEDTNQGPAEPRINDPAGDVSNDNIQAGYALPDGVEATWLNDTYADFGNGSFDIVPVNTRQYAARNQSSQSISRTLRPTIYDPPPSPLTFLLNFTTSSGIATSFNFAFYGSVHKSRKALTAPSTSWQEPGLRQHAYFDGLNRQTEPFVQFMTNNLPFNSIGTSAGSAMQLGFNNFDFPPRDNTNNYPSFSGQDLGQTGDYAVGYQAEHTSCPEATNMVEVLADSLFPRTREIMLAIHSISTSPESWGTLPQIINQASAGKNTEATRCLRYFSPSNLRRFLGIFWDDWFPHCPIFHRPSFDIQLAPLSLLMAMTLMGAALSPYSKDAEETKEWMDYVEEIAFQKACAKPTVYDCAAPNPRVERPMSLQAAFLISCLQNWEGSTESRTRVRRQRYSTLTDLARAVGFDRATHEGGRNWETDHSHFDWPQFIAIEENIRIFTFIFLVDSSYVIFNNSPLKVLLQELTFDLICPASCFTAENSKSCFYELQRLCPAGSLRSRLSFIEAVQILHQNTFDEETSAAFLQLDSVNLFSILSAIYVTISQQTTSLFGPTSLHTLLPSIHNSLSTWSLLWNARSDLPDIQALETAPPHTVEPWKRVGFFQHADEYRVFSLGVLQLLQRGHQRGRQAGVGRTKLERPLPKFDETSMEQVTRLLCSLDVT